MSIERTRSAYDAFARGDVPAILAMCDPAVDWRTAAVLPHGGSGAFRGRDAVGGFFAGIPARWENVDLKFERFVADGDGVVVLGRADGILRGHGPSGYGFVHWFTWTGDTISSFREMVDPDPTLLAAAE